MIINLRTLNRYPYFLARVIIVLPGKICSMEIKDNIFRAIFDKMPYPAFFHDEHFQLICANKAYYLAAGMGPIDALGKVYWKVFPKGAGPLPGCQEACQSKTRETWQEQITIEDKTYISFSFIDRGPENNCLCAYHVMSDISKLKYTEIALASMEAQFSALFLLSPDAIMLLDDEIFFDCNPATLRMFGCTNRNDFIGKHPSQFSPQEQPNGLSSRTFANEKINEAYSRGSSFFEWMHKRLNGTIFPTEVTLISFERNNKKVLQATVRDITNRKNQERALAITAEKLNMALTGIVTTMSKTMELRDPYTAGHQIRVAKIACGIAQKLGWNEDKLRGLQMAGLVHDIGKIAIPAEILTKPSALTQFEEKLMEQHPEHAYELLKDIDFPWPIADFVRQHHERIDGSGYPLGLKANEITPEAKILAVADTIEAMSTHRPYRPALGFQEALSEIKRNSGVKFDIEIVNTAISLFNGVTSIDQFFKIYEGS